ncbi:hypothetical protein LIER_13718 [Lithospermum erythrorhizon]|uniref:Uncharacterized protein n=1 Tax=Lithospermum erythrorhizon TaxID=34254 RepID=A0AAV3PY35_LITER
MFSNQVDLSSDRSGSQNYARDTPANQEFVSESQAATPAETALQEGIVSACEAIHANAAGLTKKKKKKTLVNGADLPTPSKAAPHDKASSLKGKEKQGGMDARVPKAWVPLVKADRPKSPLTEDTFAAMENLRRIFRHKMHWKIFCKEGEILLATKETVPPKHCYSDEHARQKGCKYPFPRQFKEVPILLGEWWNADVIDVVNERYLAGHLFSPMLSPLMACQGIYTIVLQAKCSS